MSKNLMLTFSWKDDDYPSLWLILPEKEVAGKVLPSQLTPELLVRIEVQAGVMPESYLKEKPELLVIMDPSLKKEFSVIMDPESQEPMKLLDVVDAGGAKPMTEAQLEEVLDEIEYLDNLRMKEPEPWDFTPMGP